MEKGRSLKREKLPKDIIQKLATDRKEFGSDNAHKNALGINTRTYTAIKSDGSARTDVLEKLKAYFNIVV
jgi:hypothetical protein